MDELAFRRTVYQIAVSLMKWQLILLFLPWTAVDTLFSQQKQQRIQFRTSVLWRKEVKTL